MARFALLHASDLHVGRVPELAGAYDLLRGGIAPPLGDLHLLTSHNKDAIEAFLNFSVLNQHGYDLILVTGDIASRGTSIELYAAWRHLFGSHPLSLSQSRLTKDVALLPGNHDRYVVYPDARFHFPIYFPGNQQFDRIFSAFWGSNQGVQLLWQKQKSDGTSLAIIGADLSLRPWDFGGRIHGIYGRGRVYNEHVNSRIRNTARSLIAATRAVRQNHPTATVVWAVHFEPKCTSSDLNLIDDFKLLSAASDECIPAILCGHTHQARQLNSNNIQILTCGTTGSYFTQEEKNHLQVVYFDIEASAQDTPRISVIDYHFDGMLFQKVEKGK